MIFNVHSTDIFPLPHLWMNTNQNGFYFQAYQLSLNVTNENIALNIDIQVYLYLPKK